MKIAAWVLKSEPDAFSIDDLMRLTQRTTLWDGVRNYQARNYLCAMKIGDRAFFYHSACAKPAIVGEARVVKEALADPTQFDPESKYFDAKSTQEKPRWFAPKVKFVKKYAVGLTRPVLDQTPVRTSQLFTHTRLSVVPLSAEHVRAIDALLKDGSN